MKKIFIILMIGTLLLSACTSTAPGAQNETNTGTVAEETTNANADTGTNTGSEQPEATNAEPDTKTKATISDYFPFTPDVHMRYKGTGNEFAEYESYVDYIRDNKMQVRELNGGTQFITVYTIRDGALVSTYNQGETYHRYDYTSMSSDEEIFLKEPLEPGTSWTLADGSNRSITSVDKQVTTPAGQYTALEVTTKWEDSTSRDYYVKGIGLVKSEFVTDDGQMTVLSELESIEKDVPFKHNVSLYFPQFMEDRIVFVNREIEIKTNQDMKWQFQKELKTIPEGGDLTKTLTKSTQINSILVDVQGDTVTVDLSSDFVKEMNAGTSLEGMLLRSIAKTFGRYYEKSKVILTLDGKPYESGHFLMQPGEALEVKDGDDIEFK